GTECLYSLYKRMMLPVIEQDIHVRPVEAVSQAFYIQLDIQRNDGISVRHDSKHDCKIVMAAASQESHLGPVSDHSILLLCPCGYGAKLLYVMTVSNIIDDIIVLVAEEPSLPVLSSGILHQIEDCFCVFVSNHNLPHSVIMNTETVKTVFNR